MGDVLQQRTSLTWLILEPSLHQVADAVAISLPFLLQQKEPLLQLSEPTRTGKNFRSTQPTASAWRDVSQWATPSAISLALHLLESPLGYFPMDLPNGLGGGGSGEDR